LPRTLGLAVSQIDTTIDLVLSTLLGAGAVTVFNFAQHLQQVPIGLFGASIAQAVLPTLASKYARKDMTEFKNIFIASYCQILFLVIPASIILIVLRIPIVRLVFGASTLFDWNSTVLTGKTLAFFSISLFAQALIHLLARSFYALHDSKTPVLVGTVSVLINTFLSIIFILYYHLEVWSLGLSASVASVVNMVLLLIFLDKKVGCFDRYQIFMPILKIFLAGTASGIVLYIPLKLFDQLVFDTTRTVNLILLTGISTLMGLLVDLFLAWFLEIPQVVVLARLFRRAKTLKKGVFVDATSETETTQTVKI